MLSLLLEHAEVFGNYYGTHQNVLAEAARQQKDVVLDIDVEGTRQVKSRLADAVAVLLLEEMCNAVVLGLLCLPLPYLLQLPGSVRVTLTPFLRLS